MTEAKPIDKKKGVRRTNRVAIVILTYNSERWLEPLLDSIISAKLSDQTEIIVVDNNSTDSTLERLKIYGGRVHLLRNKQNLGFARGCNIGIKKALAGEVEFVALLNDDLSVRADWLEQLFKVTDTVGPEGIFSPVQLTYDGEGLDPEMTKGILASNQKFADDLWNNRLNKSYQIPVAYFGCVLIHRSVFESIGLLDEVFFMYGEDEDFCRRARRNDIPIWLVPNSKVCHWNSAARIQTLGSRTNVQDLTRLSFYLLGLKNPDRTFISRTAWAAKELISRILHSAITGRWKTMNNAAKDALVILQKLPVIKASRKRDLEIEKVQKQLETDKPQRVNHSD